ncbi:MAG: type-4 uracil-DNA glycosylase [Desulfurococcales archaeon]|nr:type-4 uracil-DNA glycosylase [Desulfurococcales archaeon]
MAERDRVARYVSLVDAIRKCRKCPLHLHRKNPVPGEGPLDARVMLVGEAPGRREDETGRPFVGAAGHLLDALLGLAGLKREEVYITNIVKCRPPGNRDPTQAEIRACLPYLLEQIDIIRPGLLIALGRHAGRTLFSLLGRPWRGLSAEHGVPIRGTIKQLGLEVEVIATYHPAAALYNPQLRSVIEEDFRGSIREEASKLLAGRGRDARRGRSLLDFF